MRKIIFFLFLIELILLKKINALQWCESIGNNQITKKEKIIIKCFSENEITEENCHQTHFSIERNEKIIHFEENSKRNKITFNQSITRDDVIIECEKDIEEFEFVFFDEIENREKLIERSERNETQMKYQYPTNLKGVSNCAKYSPCNDELCATCNSGYYHSGISIKNPVECSG